MNGYEIQIVNQKEEKRIRRKLKLDKSNLILMIKIRTKIKRMN